jgi:transposase-like protein
VPSAATDALTDLLRDGARQMLAAAIEAEVQEFLARHQGLQDEQGRQRLVRNGYLPQRTIQTGLGDIEVKVPRVRDRAKQIRFSSAILPPYLRRTKTIEELLPWLYLKGISTGDFSEALTSLLGRDAPGLSPSTISRLKESWKDEHGRWCKRSLANKHYVYLWVDGVHFGVRLDDASQCMLVVIGATAEGKKELVAIGDGYRESEASWKEVLLDLKGRGLKIDPKLAIGDGALGFWKALPQVFGHTRGQRCWVHKTANVLNKLPKSQQPKAKAALQDIWMAASREDAHRAFDSFIVNYEAKYPKAVQTLVKDREALLAFYDFPAEHWVHIRTSNPIESTFATVRLRTAKTRGCVSRQSMLAMVFMLAKSAERGWRKLKGAQRLAEVIAGVEFKDGMPEDAKKIAA